MEALALHFPRERNGRFLRAAVWVTLASLDGAPPHLRGRWFTVRAKADDLYVGVEDLIGANQAYRWNSMPWMWDRRRRQRPRRGLAAARQHRAGAALAGGPLWSRAGWPRSLDEYAAHFQGPTLRARGITIPNRLGKCVPRPAAGRLNIVPWHAPRMISLDRRQARNRHLAAQPDQTTFAL